MKVENLASDPAKAKDALKEYQIDDVVQGNSNTILLCFYSP